MALGLPSDKCSGRRGEGRLHKKKGKLQPGQLGALREGKPSSCPLSGCVVWSRGELGAELEPGGPGLLRAPSANPTPLSLEGYPLCGPVLRVMLIVRGVFLTDGFACVVLGMSDG